MSRMVIFLTGPSGVGKSTLRDYYCKTRSIKPLPAVTTRPGRDGEAEIHVTISNDQFVNLMAQNKLCLVSENHGYLYGYLRDQLMGSSEEASIIEVDSNTAIKKQSDFNSIIVRVIPYSVEVAASKILIKHDGIADRMNDLKRQLQPEFLSARSDAGDIFFTNKYDEDSIMRFCDLIDSLRASHVCDQ